MDPKLWTYQVSWQPSQHEGFWLDCSSESDALTQTELGGAPFSDL